VTYHTQPYYLGMKGGRGPWQEGMHQVL